MWDPNWSGPLHRWRIVMKDQRCLMAASLGFAAVQALEGDLAMWAGSADALVLGVMIGGQGHETLPGGVPA